MTVLLQSENIYSLQNNQVRFLAILNLRGKKTKSNCGITVSCELHFYPLDWMYWIFMYANEPYSKARTIKNLRKSVKILIYWLNWKDFFLDLILLGWFHFHGDPAHGAPAHVPVPSRVAITGTYIEPYVNVPLKDFLTRAFKRSFDVQFALWVNRVYWCGAFGAEQCKKPSVTRRFC